MIALRGPSTWRVFIINVFTWAFADASDKTWVIGNTPLFFSARGSVVSAARKKEAKIDGIAGTKYLNDTPVGEFSFSAPYFVLET